MSKSCGRVNVFLIRHGERADEVETSELYTRRKELKERGIKRIDRYDPPLTQTGRQQAKVCGEKLRTYMEENNISFDVVYSSPFIRTMETANEIALALDLPLKPVAALGGCAAAVKMIGLEKFVCREDESSPSFVRQGDFDLLRSPAVDEKQGCSGPQVLPENSEVCGFVEMCQRLAQDSSERAQSNVLFVLHREGIYDLVSNSPDGCLETWRWGRSIPYCCTVHLTLEVVDQVVDQVDEKEKGGEMGAVTMCTPPHTPKRATREELKQQTKWALAGFDLFDARPHF